MSIAPSSLSLGNGWGSCCSWWCYAWLCYSCVFSLSSSPSVVDCGLSHCQRLAVPDAGQNEDFSPRRASYQHVSVIEHPPLEGAGATLLRQPRLLSIWCISFMELVNLLSQYHSWMMPTIYRKSSWCCYIAKAPRLLAAAPTPSVFSTQMHHYRRPHYRYCPCPFRSTTSQNVRKRFSARLPSRVLNLKSVTQLLFVKRHPRHRRWRRQYWS